MEAIKKLEAEKSGIDLKNRYKNVLWKPVYETLVNFCRQNPEFAQAIEQTDKTLDDCLTAVCKGIGSSISDLDVYRRAAEFYFPGCVVEMTLTIRMSEYEEAGEANCQTPVDTVPAVQDVQEIKLDLLDLI